MAFQFGSFEVNPRAGELRKHGVRIKLQDQPFRILLCLLENAGQVVAREQIQQTIWPDNTYVDYENAINSAIRKLREALNDSSDNPRFVETLPRRGYRFLAPVTQTADAVSVQEPTPAVVRKEPQSGLQPMKDKSAWSKHPWRLLLWTAGVVSSIVAGGAFWIARENRAPRALLPVPLTAFQGDERYTTFSPDGSQVAFSWDGEKQDNSDIYVMLIGSGKPLRLTTDPAIDLAPAWSPDGKTISFVRREASKLKYMVIPALGGPEREIAELMEQHYPNSLFINPPTASWSPDGRSLLVSGRGFPDQPSGLWLISVETGEKRQLTLPPSTYWGDFSGAFSPEGRTVAFARSDGVQSGDLYVLPLTADFTPQGDPRRLTNDNRPIGGITWTHGGNNMVYSSLSGASWSLWRIVSSGSHEPVRLTVGENGLLPSISRHGNRLAYTQSIPDTDIWRVKLSEPREPPVRLIASTRLDTNPQYSPDGKRIAFESSRSGKQEVWVCDEDGSNASQLVTIGRSGSPRWSPDGQWIVFDSNVEGHWQIYIVSAQGGRPRRLTNAAANDVRPSWSPDGKWIYFGSNRSTGGPRPQVWKVPAAGGEPTQVTKNGGYTPFPSKDGQTIYFFKDDSRTPSLWKAPAEGGEEVKVLDAATSEGFAVTGVGIYFVRRERLQFLDFSTGLAKTILKLEKPTGLGVSASPDDHWLLLTERNEGNSDLMLVENFR